MHSTSTIMKSLVGLDGYFNSALVVDLFVLLLLVEHVARHPRRF